MSRHERPLCFHHHHRSALLATIKSIADDDNDNVDAEQRQAEEFKILNPGTIFLMAFSFVSYIVDLIFDASLATTYYLAGQYWYFGLTLLFVIVPSLTITFLSLWWYISDSRDPECPTAGPVHWLIRAIFLIVQLAPILRQMEALRFALKARQYYPENRQTAKRYLLYMMFESTDGSMLRMFEAFMESAPQLVLQLTIIVIEFPQGNLNFMTVISVINSLGWLSWSLAAYINKLRHSLPHKRKLSPPAVVVLSLWRFFMIGSRVITLALFASRFPRYVGLICALHWLAMFIWLRRMNTNFSNNHYEEIVYNAIMAIMYIFCFVNPIESPARFRYTAFYMIMLLENASMLTCWFLVDVGQTETAPLADTYRIFLLILCAVNFLLGLLMMAIFMLFFHPTINIFTLTNPSGTEAAATAVQYSPDDSSGSNVQIHAVWTTKVPWLHEDGKKTDV